MNGACLHDPPARIREPGDRVHEGSIHAPIVEPATRWRTLRLERRHHTAGYNKPR
jgi:hypothetical protein